MKITFTKLLVCFLIVSGFVLSSCEKDLYDASNSKDNKFIVNTISFKDLKNKSTKISNIANKLEQKQKLKEQSKMVFDSINNFYIYEDSIKQIRLGDYESYTLAIKRDNTEKVENLLFSKNVEGNFDIFIVKYGLTSDELQNAIKNGISHDINFDSYEMDENGMLLDKYFQVICITSGAWVWASETVGAGSTIQPPLHYIFVESGTDCIFSSNGGGGLIGAGVGNSGPTGSNNGPTGYNGSNGTNPNNTNPTGGVYGNGGTNGLGVYTIPVIPKLTTKDIKIAYTSWLLEHSNTATLNWWNNQNNETIVDEIVTYLTANQDYFVEEQSPNEFALQCITQMAQNPGLHLNIASSFKSPANIDRSTITNATPEGTRFNQVYDQLLKSPKFKELFLDMFQNSDKFNVKFQIGPTQNNANGDTKVFLENPTLNTITISPQFLNSNNKLVIAKTILHECIHAYLNVKLCEPTIGMSIPNINNMDLNSIVNQQYNGFNGDQTQHNFIYNFMLPTMVQILSEIKDLLVTPANNIEMLNDVVVFIPLNNSPQSAFIWSDYYHNLSLNGLQNCTFFQNEIGSVQVINGVLTPIITINQFLMQSFIQYITVGQFNIQP